MVALLGSHHNEELLPPHSTPWYVHDDQDVPCGPYPARLLAQTQKAEATMPTLLVFHEVDDVEHWLSSPKREEVFGPLGITVRTFSDPAKSQRVGLIVQVPDMETFQRIMESETTADAMKFDGVRPETILVLVES
jgi:hypothetical protein